MLHSRLLGILLLIAGLAICAPASAAWDPPPGVELTRPRLLFRPADLPVIRERLEREPYRRIAFDMLQRVRQADGVSLEDESIEGQRIKARAAKNQAFFYAVDRLPQGDAASGVVRAFATDVERQAAGDRVRDWLLHMYTRSRLAVPPPLGGTDRDISTSEELLQYATAYDTLKGGGYVFDPGDEAQIVENLVDLASELYQNYVDPRTAGHFALQHQNNHRSKSGAAMAAAAVVLAEYTPPPGSDPDAVRDPAFWLPYGLEQIDSVMRYVLVSGDGAYGEGPFYLRFACQNLLPFLRGWDRLLAGRPFDVGGHSVPSLWRHPLFARSMRWALDMTLPPGYGAHIDDGNPYRYFYFGAAPPGSDGSAFAWRWSTGDRTFETEGNVDLGADSIVHFDDSVLQAPPTGSPTAFYPEGGDAIFRSDWSRDAVVAVVVGEYGAAAEFGRDRFGLGVSPQSHEHADPGAFLLHAFGERLALDPGYGNFGQRFRVNQPEHHNTILVNGSGPRLFLGASVAWPLDPLGPRPGDGDAMISDNLDGDFLDATRVTTRYGPLPARIERRFLFADDRYLVVADRVDGAPGPEATYTWLLHGNGGGTGGGSYVDTPAGGRWEFGAGRLDGGFTAAGVPMIQDTALSEHEGLNGQYVDHVVHRAHVAPREGETEVRSLGLVYPSPSSAPAPTLFQESMGETAALKLEDPVGDRVVTVAHRAPTAGTALLSAADAETDGHLLLLDTRSDGSPRLAWAEGASLLRVGGRTWLETRTPGVLGMRRSGAQVEVVAGGADPVVRVGRLPFRAVAADYACGLERSSKQPVVRLGRERRFVLRASAGNAAPAADPGPDRGATTGEWVTLDGARSCDSDGDVLVPRWALTSAPAGSAWTLERTDSWTPRLHADRPGPFRVRLVVTDVHGAQSREAEVLVLAGGPCENQLDDDRDGLFDAADPDCDTLPSSRAPVALADHYSIRRGRRVMPQVSVLSNDSDADGDVMVAVLVQGPTHGELHLGVDGRFSYSADPGFSGSDGFMYLARDAGWAESAPVRVTLEGGPPSHGRSRTPLFTRADH